MAYSYKGAIEFGLVYIPITLSPCIKNNDIGFHMIEKKTKSRIKYIKTCVDCNEKKVDSADIVKGYEYEKGKYVIFTDKDFESLKTPKDKHIVIDEFVDIKDVDPVYFDRSYYVSPVGADRAFLVLLKAMEQKGKAGICKTVLGTKETLILLRVKNGKMLLNTMFFSDEVVDSPKLQKTTLQKKEVDLAVTLIEQMSSTFQPEKYKDEYNLRIKKAIKKKISGGQIVEPHDEPQPAKIINIMDALKASLKSDTTKKKEKDVTKKVQRKA